MKEKEVVNIKFKFKVIVVEKQDGNIFPPKMGLDWSAQVQMLFASW
jgi:hypothetical protein